MRVSVSCLLLRMVDTNVEMCDMLSDDSAGKPGNTVIDAGVARDSVAR